MARIVVGVDGSEHSKQALAWAGTYAEQVGADLQVLMVWDNPGRDMWLPHVPPQGDPLVLTRQALRRMVDAVLGPSPTIRVEPMAVEGAPAHTLVDAAAGAELLVVGNRGRGGFAGVLLGSVSFHCVSHAPCPVVVVRGRVPGRPPASEPG
ncbi:MAG: universal stress protein [Actinomycetota bacterium]|jgi:nucleotide-binding universal stress UspA family protein|nr:universal stress protein [Actinomycetota bacterium]